MHTHTYTHTHTHAHTHTHTHRINTVPFMHALRVNLMIPIMNAVNCDTNFIIIRRVDDY